jgi:translation initiation factor 2 beta subunit (eIF-2beta)/eIF-5
MCQECIQKPVSTHQVFFTMCAYCENLSDHKETFTSEGICLECENCGNIMFPEDTKKALEIIRLNRLKLGLV